MAKRKITLTIDESLIEWCKMRAERDYKYASVSHLVEFAVSQLREMDESSLK